MNELSPTTEAASPPIPLAVVLATRVTDCQCGAVYSSPEVYGRYPGSRQKPGLFLRRLPALLPYRLPIERRLIRVSVPFCCICISGHDPMHGLPAAPEQPKLENLRPQPAPAEPPKMIARASRPTTKRPSVAKLTLDDIFNSI